MAAGEATGWYFSILTGAVLLTWIFNSTRGNVFIAAVFHGTMDIAFVSPGPHSTTTVLGALITLWGIAIILLAGPRDLSSSGKVTLESQLPAR